MRSSFHQFPAALFIVAAACAIAQSDRPAPPNQGQFSPNAGYHRDLTLLAPNEAPPRAFLRLIQREKVPLAPQWELLSSEGGLERAHFSYASDATQRVP